MVTSTQKSCSFAPNFICLRKIIVLVLLCTAGATSLRAQFLMDMLDTTKEAGKGLLGIYKKYDHLRIGGYIQPQYQAAPANGTKSYEGGDFATHVNNRFMLRRSRVRIDYVHINNQQDPGVQIVFQFDANERTFTVRDVWGRIFDNKLKLFSFTTGMFARPFGYEVNLSSSDRESPERGRMSQALMKSERDLGAMISLDARKNYRILNHIKLEAGLFNGQGINATGDFDNKKDLIARAALKPLHLNKSATLTAGVSILQGGLLQNTKYVYTTNNSDKVVEVDSSASNIGTTSPRKYRGADIQLKIKNKFGYTELRAEYLAGTQTGTANSNETPNALVSGRDGFYRRRFNGAYFYFLQNIFSSRHQLVLKYDWYDPNSRVAGQQITSAAKFTVADIKFSTLNIGYVYHITPVAKLVLFYAMVKNEKTGIAGYTSDVSDNIFTSRIQFRF
ncbi:MAG: hypothetical protein RL172_1611 [Bacteroidota bacterium]|jgi:hypothetical protein